MSPLAFFEKLIVAVTRVGPVVPDHSGARDWKAEYAVELGNTSYLSGAKDGPRFRVWFSWMDKQEPDFLRLQEMAAEAMLRALEKDGLVVKGKGETV